MLLTIIMIGGYLALWILCLVLYIRSTGFKFPPATEPWVSVQVRAIGCTSVK